MRFKLFLIAFFFEYFRPGFYLGFLQTLKLNSIIPLSVLFLSLTQNKEIPNGQVFKSTQAKYFLFLLFILLISLLLSDVTLYVWRCFKLEIGYFFLFVIIAKETYSVDRLKSFFLILIISHLMLIYFNPDLVLHPEVRSYIEGTTFLGDGNDFALSVSILIPMCLFIILDEVVKYKKIIYILMLGLLFIIIIGTSSRGGSLAVGASLFYMWLHSERKFAGVVAVLVLMVGVLIYAPPTYFSRMQSIKAYDEDGSAQGRIMAWKSALRMAADRPILGVGAGHFPVKLGVDYRPPEFADRELPWLTAHSMYFLVLGELGLPGIFYLLGLLWCNYNSNAKILREIHGDGRSDRRSLSRLVLCVNSSLVAFSVGGAFLSVTYYPHIFVLSGVVLSVNLYYQRKKKEWETMEPDLENEQQDLHIKRLG